MAPILLLISGFTIELARFVRFRQIADVISKEAAFEAYRKCDILNVDASGNVGSDPVVNIATSTADTVACLNDVAGQFQATVAAAGLNNARVILSLYRYDFQNLAPQDAPACNPATSAFTQMSTSAVDSAFSTNGNSINGPTGAVANQTIGCQLGRIVVSEMAFFYTPIINFRIVGFSNSFDTNFQQSPLRRDVEANYRNAFRETTIL